MMMIVSQYLWIELLEVNQTIDQEGRAKLVGGRSG